MIVPSSWMPHCSSQIACMIQIAYCFFIGIWSLQFNQCHLQNDRLCRSFHFFLHLLTPVDFHLFWAQCNHHNFGLPAFLLLCVFARNAFFIVLSSDILTRWSAHSSFLLLFTRFGFLYITCNSSLVQILQPFWSLIGMYIFCPINGIRVR